jgi:hypothetical protein
VNALSKEQQQVADGNVGNKEANRIENFSHGETLARHRRVIDHPALSWNLRENETLNVQMRDEDTRTDDYFQFLTYIKKSD